MKCSIECTLRIVLLSGVIFPCTGIEALRREYKADLQSSPARTIYDDDNCRTVLNILQIIRKWESEVSKSDDIYCDHLGRFPAQISSEENPLVQKLFAVKFLKTLLSAHLNKCTNEQPTNIESTASNLTSQEILKFKWYPLSFMMKRGVTVGESVDKSTSEIEHLIDGSDGKRDSGFTSRRLLQTENESSSLFQPSSLLENTKKRIERIKKWKKIGKIIFPTDNEAIEDAGQSTMIRKRRAKKKQSNEEDLELLQMDDRATEAHSEFSMTTRSVPFHSDEIVWNFETDANATNDESGNPNLEDDELQKHDRITEQVIEKEIVPVEEEVFVTNELLTKDKSHEDSPKEIRKEDITIEKPHPRRRKKKVVITLPGKEISERIPRFKRFKKYRKKNRELIKRRVKRRLRRDSKPPLISDNSAKYMTLDLPKISATLKEATLQLQDSGVVPSSTPLEASKQSTSERTKGEILPDIPNTNNALPVDEKSLKSKGTPKKHEKVEKEDKANAEKSPAILAEADQDKKKNSGSKNKRQINDTSKLSQIEPRTTEMEGTTPIGYSTHDSKSILPENGRLKKDKKAEESSHIQIPSDSPSAINASRDEQIQDEKSPKSKDTLKKHKKVEKEEKANSDPTEESPSILTEPSPDERQIDDIPTPQQRKRRSKEPKEATLVGLPSLPENGHVAADKKAEALSQVETLSDLPSIIQDEKSPKNISRKRKKVEKEDKVEPYRVEENPAVLTEPCPDDNINNLSKNGRQIDDISTPWQSKRRVKEPKGANLVGLSGLPENKNVAADKKGEPFSQAEILSDLPSIQDEKSQKNIPRKRKKVEKEDKAVEENPPVLQESCQDNTTKSPSKNKPKINDLPQRSVTEPQEANGLVEYVASNGLPGLLENKDVEADKKAQDFTQAEILSDLPNIIQDEESPKSKDTSKKRKKVEKDSKVNSQHAGEGPLILKEPIQVSEDERQINDIATPRQSKRRAKESKGAPLVEYSADNGLSGYPEKKNVEVGKTVEDSPQIGVLSHSAGTTNAICDREIQDEKSPKSNNSLKKRKKSETGDKENPHTVRVTPTILEESAAKQELAALGESAANDGLSDFPENENVEAGKRVEDLSQVEILSNSPVTINKISDGETLDGKSPKGKDNLTKRKKVEKEEKVNPHTLGVSPTILEESATEPNGDTLHEYPANDGLSDFFEEKNIQPGQTAKDSSVSNSPGTTNAIRGEEVQGEISPKSKDSLKKHKKLEKGDGVKSHHVEVSPTILEESATEPNGVTLIEYSADNKGPSGFPENENMKAVKTLEDLSQVEILSNPSTTTNKISDKETLDQKSPKGKDDLPKRKKKEKEEKANPHAVGLSHTVLEDSAAEPNGATAVENSADKKGPSGFLKNKKADKTVEDLPQVEILSNSPTITNNISDGEILHQKSPKGKDDLTKRQKKEKEKAISEAVGVSPTILEDSVTEPNGATIVENSADNKGPSGSPENEKAGKTVEDLSQVEIFPCSPDITNKISIIETPAEKSPKGKDNLTKRKKAEKEEKVDPHPTILEHSSTEPNGATPNEYAANDGHTDSPDEKNVQPGQTVKDLLQFKIFSNSPTKAIGDKEVEDEKIPSSKDTSNKHAEKLEKETGVKSPNVGVSPTILEQSATEPNGSTLVQYLGGIGLPGFPVKTGKVVENLSQVQNLSASPSPTSILCNKEIQDKKNPKSKDTLKKHDEKLDKDKANSHNVLVSPTVLKETATELNGATPNEYPANDGLTDSPDEKNVQPGQTVEDLSQVEILSNSPATTNALRDKEVGEEEIPRGKDTLSKHAEQLDKETGVKSPNIERSPTILEQSATKPNGASLVQYLADIGLPGFPVKAGKVVEDLSQVQNLSASPSLQSKDTLKKHVEELDKDKAKSPILEESARESNRATLVQQLADNGLFGFLKNKNVEAGKTIEELPQVLHSSNSPETSNAVLDREIQDEKIPKSDDTLKRRRRDKANPDTVEGSPKILEESATELRPVAVVESTANGGLSDFPEDANRPISQVKILSPETTNAISDKASLDDKSPKSNDTSTKNKKLKKEDAANFHPAEETPAAIKECCQDNNTNSSSKIERQVDAISTPSQINPKVSEFKQTIPVQSSTNSGLSGFPKNERVEAGKEFEDLSQVDILSEVPSIIQDEKSPKSKDILKKQKTVEKEDSTKSHCVGVSPTKVSGQDNNTMNESQISDISTSQKIEPGAIEPKIATVIESAVNNDPSMSPENKNIEAGKKFEDFSRVESLLDAPSTIKALCDGEIPKSISKKDKTVEKEGIANLEENTAILQEVSQNNNGDRLSKNDRQMNDFTSLQSKPTSTEPRDAPLVENSVTNGLSRFLEDKKVETGKKVENFIQNGLQNDKLPVNLLKTSFMKLAKQQNPT